MIFSYGNMNCMVEICNYITFFYVDVLIAQIKTEPDTMHILEFDKIRLVCSTISYGIQTHQNMINQRQLNKYYQKLCRFGKQSLYLMSYRAVNPVNVIT